MHGDPLAQVLLALVIILAAAKLFGEIFERLKQPSVLGELFAGLVMGNIVLLVPSWNFFEPLRAEITTHGWPYVIDIFARLGVILLLFEVGLESTVAEMRKVGGPSLLVAVAGVVAPFILGFGVSWLFIREMPADLTTRFPPHFSLTNIHIFIGATLCATSVGITARVLKDLGKLQTKEARIILGAAVIDDVLGLVILATVAGVVSAALTGGSFTAASIVRVIALAIGFLALSILVGITLVPRILRLLAKLRTQGIMIISSLLFCFILAWLADMAGLATIVGAFAAGLILEEVHFAGFREKVSLHQLIHPISSVFVPVFFVLMGIRVRLETFTSVEVLGIALALTVAAIVGKQICGLMIKEKGLDRLSIGLGMIPRGEVGLIFAGIGKSMGIFDDGLFSAVVIMVMITTLVTPPALSLSLSRHEKKKAEKSQEENTPNEPLRSV